MELHSRDGVPFWQRAIELSPNRLGASLAIEYLAPKSRGVTVSQTPEAAEHRVQIDARGVPHVLDVKLGPLSTPVVTKNSIRVAICRT
jgi:hypothetical protein